MNRKIYLEDIALEDALSRFLRALELAGALSETPAERIPVAQALGRVTAAPIWAPISSPHYHGAAMDGAAVLASETQGASEATPVRLKLGSQATIVDTGDPLPASANAVIMIENILMLDGEIEIMAPVAPWQHVRPMGEDIVATELVLPQGRVLDPFDLGAITACGHTHVEVRARPRVAILPTGTELVEPSVDLKPGDIIEFNSVMLAAQASEWGAVPTRLEKTVDDYTLLKHRISDALDSHDIVLVNAGSSAGSEDFTARIVSELGTLVSHGCAIRPGHPIILGTARGKALLGIPGYPVSAVLTSELFVRPVVYRKLGTTPPNRETMKAVVTRKVLSPMGEDEFMRVKLGRVGDRVMATPLQRGAGVIMSLVRADGIVKIPRFSEGLQAGTEVSVDLLRPRHQVERTIVAIGSHDLTLDLISSELSRAYEGLTLSSANVGSLGGLIALQRGEAHLAGSHLLDEDTGTYNVDYVKRMLPGQDVVLVNLVYRDQGLMVQPGNPKGIRAIEDLARPGIRFVNRQRGAGTRVLLDYQLKQRGIAPSEIEGYTREEFTHLTVASSVAGGTADVGLGIAAAARALKLDFVPILQERYDLIIPRRYLETEHLQALLELLRQPSFQQRVGAIEGYDARDMGCVMAEISV
ncbi:MAG: molybdopterin biosynthesis protein [Chloroflexota bacterium]